MLLQALCIISQPLVNSNWSYSPETLNSGQNKWFFFGLCELEIWRMTLKNNRAPLIWYLKLCVSFHSHWSIQTGVTVRKRPIRVKIDDFFVPCDLEIWQMTLENNRAPLLYYFKLSALFHSHLWIQTGVTVQKRLNWGKICFDLCDHDLWLWSFAWTFLLPMVITPENFMMIRWQEHCEKGGTDGWTERSVLRAPWSQLKIFRYMHEYMITN